jgi:anti-sigma factor RsiW
MNDCPNGDVRDLLPDLVHDRLAPAVRREVEAHAAGCADCREELALLRTMRAWLRHAPAVNAAAIAAAIPAYRAPVRRSRAGWRAAAAIVILAAGGGSVAVLRGGSDVARDSSTVTAAAPRELAMGSGAIGDLDDRELSALLRDLESLDALPPADVENATTVIPVDPAGTN